MARSANFEQSSLSSSLSTISKSLLSESTDDDQNVKEQANKFWRSFPDAMQIQQNGDLIVANSNRATFSAYSLPISNQQQNSPSLSPSNQPIQESKNYVARRWFSGEDESSWQLDELGRAVCSIQSFNELDTINVTNLARSGKQLGIETGDHLKYFSMNQQNIMFKNNQKWGNLFKPDICLSGKIASIKCKEFGKLIDNSFFPIFYRLF